MTDHLSESVSISERFWKEMRNFGVIASYLFLCFLILELYRSAVLEQNNVHSLTLGIALGKALIIGKFILIGDAVKAGTRISSKTVLHRIAWKTLAFWLMLMVFNFLEDLIVGWFHHRSIAQIVSENFSRTWVEIVAPSMVILMVLIPLICFFEINRALGPGVLKSLLLSAEADD